MGNIFGIFNKSINKKKILIENSYFVDLSNIQEKNLDSLINHEPPPYNVAYKNNINQSEFKNSMLITQIIDEIEEIL